MSASVVLVDDVLAQLFGPLGVADVHRGSGKKSFYGVVVHPQVPVSEERVSGFSAHAVCDHRIILQLHECIFEVRNDVRHEFGRLQARGDIQRKFGVIGDRRLVFVSLVYGSEQPEQVEMQQGSQGQSLTLDDVVILVGEDRPPAFFAIFQDFVEVGNQRIGGLPDIGNLVLRRGSRVIVGRKGVITGELIADVITLRQHFDHSATEGTSVQVVRVQLHIYAVQGLPETGHRTESRLFGYLVAGLYIQPVGTRNRHQSRQDNQDMSILFHCSVLRN